MSYRFILSLHIIGIISWMAGVLYLYRLFVYHAQETHAEVKARFEVMEHRLYTYITAPAMYFSILMGGWMITLNTDLMKYGWFHGKLAAVFLLIGITQMAAPFKRKLKAGECKISSKAFRFLNEVPTILMIIIVMLVILRP